MSSIILSEPKLGYAPDSTLTIGVEVDYSTALSLVGEGNARWGSGGPPVLNTTGFEPAGLSGATKAALVPVLDAAITGITYNSDSTIHVVTYGSGLVITYTYNTDGSVHTSSDGTTTRTFTYNSDGTLASVA